MGKSKKSKSSKGGGGTEPCPYSLADQILEDKSVRPIGRTKDRGRQESDDKFVESKLSQRILEQAREQQEELEEEHGFKREVKLTPQVSLSTPGASKQASDDEGEAEDDEDGYNEIYENIDINAEDEQAMATFMSETPGVRRTLADIINEKLTEKKTEIQTQFSDNASIQMKDMDPRVVKMYKNIRSILSRYRSGKLPKAFKIIPNLQNWEQVLYMTEPDMWSAAAMYQATRIFATGLNAKMAQRFYHLVLYPRIRDDIQEYKRLNFHLYMALRKAVFRPAAFFKGIIIPLCESGDCTLREAIIVSSILGKISIPVLHSAAAILKIAEMDYNGANSIFLRTLLDKKYALPFRVIDGMVFHFLRFLGDRRSMPVLWHQCFLTFVQRYKQDISSEQKESLLELLKAQKHDTITPEIRRELVNSKCRDEETGTVPEMSMEDD